MLAAPLSRRRVLGALGLGAATLVPLALGGCVPSATRPDASSPAAVEADRLLLAGVTGRLVAVRAVVRRTRAASAADRRRFAALARLHAAHLEALGSAGPAGTSPAPSPIGADGTAVRVAETAWIGALTDAAVAASEPRLTLLLGAMAAATGQQLTRLSGTAESDHASAPTTSTADTAVVEGLQCTLAAEHAALYVVETLGARTAVDSTLRDRFEHLAERHRTRREELITMLLAAGAAPVGPDSSYGVIDEVTPAALTARAGTVEEALLPRYAALAAAGTDDLRRWALTRWRTSAEVAVSLGRRPAVLPGIAGN